MGYPSEVSRLEGSDLFGRGGEMGRRMSRWRLNTEQQCRTAGWMFRVAVESIFGFSTEGGRVLVVKPAISAKWPKCRLTYRLPGETTRYEITIENPDGKEGCVSSATLDGAAMDVENGAARVPLVHDGGTHRSLPHPAA